MKEAPKIMKNLKTANSALRGAKTTANVAWAAKKAVDYGSSSYAGERTTRGVQVAQRAALNAIGFGRMSREDRVMADLAKEAYRPPSRRLAYWEGYKLIKFKSSHNQISEFSLYKNVDKKRIVIAFHGTKPERGKDWDANAHIVSGRENESVRFHNALATFDEIRRSMKSTKHYAIYIIGHSLGGSIALFITHKRSVVSKAVVFNPGVVWNKATNLQDRRNRFICVLGDFVSHVALWKKLNWRQLVLETGNIENHAELAGKAYRRYLSDSDAKMRVTLTTLGIAVLGSIKDGVWDNHVMDNQDFFSQRYTSYLKQKGEL